MLAPASILPFCRVVPGGLAAEQSPPAELVCVKCGNRVFRSFFDVARPDEVERDFRESTERDLAPNDDEADVTRADILDLNNP
ncbi:MAG: hypothetical protein HY703_02325 [Gemmatimonadetes bacterium]|nr:hypothetical protein [Gemmatimonadota bacterium]